MAETGTAKLRIPRMAKGASAQAQTIIVHPNDSGFAKDETGAIPPAYFIESLTVEFEGEVVYQMKLGPSLSKDPYVEFSLAVDKPGRLRLTWRDNKGAVFTREQAVEPV